MVIDTWDDPNSPLERPVLLGPNADPTFPSLPAGASTRPEIRNDLIDDSAISSVSLARNVFALTRRSVRPVAAADVPGVSVYPKDFDRPERERIHEIAAEFVKGHVRVIRHEFAIKTPQRQFGAGTIVISQDPVPTTVLRHARFQWAITNGIVVELRNVRLPVGHLALYEPCAELTSDEGWPGAERGLAIFLAYLFELLGIKATTSLGAVGEINFSTNAIGAVSDIDPYLERAKSDALSDLMVPFASGKMSGQHNHVRYWSVHDTNEAAYSALTHLAGEVVVPNLYRRALTKQAYSWAALILILAAGLANALAGSLSSGGEPPVDFVRIDLVVGVVLLIGSLTCTHRYWRRDR
jgi:hypothetical protein